jgi:hypothetical protein
MLSEPREIPFGASDTMRAPSAVLLLQARMAQSDRGTARTRRFRQQIGRQLPARRRELLRRGDCQPTNYNRRCPWRCNARSTWTAPTGEGTPPSVGPVSNQLSPEFTFLVFGTCVKNGYRHRVLRSQSPFLTLESVEACSQPRELLTGGWRSPDAHSIISVLMDMCQVQSVISG